MGARGPFPDVENLTSLKINVQGEWSSNEMLSVKEELRDRFGKYGEIGDVYITRSRTLAFVRFKEKQDAEEAMEKLDGEKICGNDIQVTMSEQRKKQPDEYPEGIRERSRSRGRGRGGGGRGRSRSRSRDRHRGRDKDRDRGREKDRGRDKDRGRERGRGRDKDKDRGRDKGRGNKRGRRDEEYSYDEYDDEDYYSDYSRDPTPQPRRKKGRR